MQPITVFYQSCPVCGRSLRIPAKYFGRLMSCTHCEGEFLAGKDELPPAREATFPDVVKAPLALNQAQLGEI